MGLCKTSHFSIFTFIYANDLKLCTRSYSSCVYRMMRFKGSNGKICKMRTSHFRTLLVCIKTKSTAASLPGTGLVAFHATMNTSIRLVAKKRNANFDTFNTSVEK